jgi:hypothetical protein
MSEEQDPLINELFKGNVPQRSRRRAGEVLREMIRRDILTSRTRDLPIDIISRQMQERTALDSLLQRAVGRLVVVAVPLEFAAMMYFPIMTTTGDRSLEMRRI